LNWQESDLDWVKALPAVLAGLGCCLLAQAARGGM
jgi:hypothetical protein